MASCQFDRTTESLSSNANGIPSAPSRSVSARRRRVLCQELDSSFQIMSDDRRASRPKYLAAATQEGHGPKRCVSRASVPAQLTEVVKLPQSLVRWSRSHKKAGPGDRSWRMQRIRKMLTAGHNRRAKRRLFGGIGRKNGKCGVAPRRIAATPGRRCGPLRAGQAVDCRVGRGSPDTRIISTKQISRMPKQSLAEAICSLGPVDAASNVPASKSRQCRHSVAGSSQYVGAIQPPGVI